VTASTHDAGDYIDAAQTYRLFVEFPADSDDVTVHLHEPTPGLPHVTSVTRTCHERAALEGGTMGFHVGRIGTPLYFDDIRRTPL